MKKIKVLVLVVCVMVIFQVNFAQVYSTFSGKVVDEETGEGINGVRILLYKGISAWTETKTKENGDFIIKNILPGKYGLEFCPPEPYAWDYIDHLLLEKGTDNFPFGMQTVILEKWKNTHIIKKCKKGNILEIKTVDKSTNIPIQGVHVLFKKGVNLSLLNKGKNLALTNNQGLCRLSQLLPGKIEVVLDKEGLWIKVISNIEIQDKQVNLVNVEYDLENPTKIQGCIKCKDIVNPIENIEVHIHSLDNWKWSICYTNKNGEFSMSDMEPGNYEISIFKKNIEDDQREIVKKIVLLTGHTGIVDFTIDCGADFLKKGD